jgi:hypothetical protein
VRRFIDRFWDVGIIFLGLLNVLVMTLSFYFIIQLIFDPCAVLVCP